MKNMILNYLGFMIEFLDQIAYVGYVVAIAFTLFTVLPITSAVIYAVVLLLHLISIAAFGCAKNCYDIGYEHPMYFVVPFIIFNVIIFGISAIIANALISLALFIFLAILIFLCILFTERMICETVCNDPKKRPWLEIFLAAAPNIFCIILFALPIICIIIPLLLLNIPIILKIIIPIIYIISMPFIALSADNGFDIREVTLLDEFI